MVALPCILEVGHDGECDVQPRVLNVPILTDGQSIILRTKGDDWPEERIQEITDTMQKMVNVGGRAFLLRAQDIDIVIVPKGTVIEHQGKK